MDKVTLPFNCRVGKLITFSFVLRLQVLIFISSCSRNECYNLDSFFGQGDRVGRIFQREVSTVIPGIFEGLNATVFAYGATGSGKTYTMQVS